MKAKNNTHGSFRLFISTWVILITLLVACNKNDTPIPNPNPPSSNNVQFAEDAYSVAENSAGLSIDLTLRSKLSANSKVAVKIQGNSAGYGTDYVTEPALINGKIVVQVAAGSEKATIRVVPVNNDQPNIEREITLLLEQEEAGIKPEGKVQSKVNITDDETSSLVSFREATAGIMENSPTGYELILDIQPAAAENGFADVQVQSANAVYGQHYTTLPAAINGTIRVPVQAGKSFVSLVVFGTDNPLLNAPRVLNFALSATSGGLVKGNQKTNVFTIEDDDRVPFMPIGSIRSGFTGTQTTFTTSTIIAGVVTSVNDNIEPNTVYVEDANAGIAIRLKNRNQLQAGDYVTVELEGSHLSETNGILNLNGVQNGMATKIGFEVKEVPGYKPVQLYQSGQDMEGRIVTLNDVWFINANGTNTLYGEQRVTDGARQIIVRTEAFASFANRIIPAGIVSVTGILVWRNNEYTIYPQKSADIR